MLAFGGSSECDKEPLWTGTSRLTITMGALWPDPEHASWELVSLSGDSARRWNFGVHQKSAGSAKMYVFTNRTSVFGGSLL